MPEKKTGEVSVQAFCIFLGFLENLLARKVYSEGEKAREALLEKMKVAHKNLSLMGHFGFHDTERLASKHLSDSLSFIPGADNSCISAVNNTVMVGMLFFHNVGELLPDEEVIAIKRESRLKELIFPGKEDLGGKALKKVMMEYPLK